MVADNSRRKKFKHPLIILAGFAGTFGMIRFLVKLSDYNRDGDKEAYSQAYVN